MKIVTAYFKRKKIYKTLLTHFLKSSRKVMPKVEIKIIKMELPTNIDHKRDTAYAFIAAAEYALKSRELLAICDCDLFFRKSIIDIEKEKFDIAITVRNSKMKYNTGLWFFRPTSKARTFLKRWIKNTNIIINNFTKYEHLAWSWGGPDQASLFNTIKRYGKDINILELPCSEWNATQSEWPIIDDNTRVIHIKSKLRSAIFGKMEEENIPEYMKPIIKRWNEYVK